MSYILKKLEKQRQSAKHIVWEKYKNVKPSKTDLPRGIAFTEWEEKSISD